MNNALNSYSLLARLPLFQGMSGAEFDDIISRVRLGFSKVEAGEDILVEGELADRMVFVVKGELSSEAYSDDRGYSVVEALQVPCVLQPERLFGLTQRYSKTFRATAPCSLLSIGKRDVVSLTTSSEVFRINVLNMLCTMTQKMHRMPWRSKPDDIRRKIFMFVANRCIRPAGYKVLNIGMVRLGHEINESRLNVSRALKTMNGEGIVVQKKNQIVIPSLERLLHVPDENL